VSPTTTRRSGAAGEGKFAPPGVNPGKAVHMMDIHAEKGMQCADCHFAQDSHGNGFIIGEVANASRSLQGLPRHRRDYPNLRTSGPAAPPARHRPRHAAQPRTGGGASNGGTRMGAGC
jgi:hypothetical protein